MNITRGGLNNCWRADRVINDMQHVDGCTRTASITSMEMTIVRIECVCASRPYPKYHVSFINPPCVCIVPEEIHVCVYVHKAGRCSKNPYVYMLDFQ
jgi:hypothetical protein